MNKLTKRTITISYDRRHANMQAIANAILSLQGVRVVYPECERCEELVATLEMVLTDFRTALDQWHGLSDELRGKEKNWIHNSKDPEAKLYRQIEQGWKHIRVLLDKYKD